MEEERDNLLTAVIGRKRIGKSNETLRQLLIKAYHDVHKSKALIFDVNDEFGAYRLDGKEEHNIKKIYQNDILAYSAYKGYEVRRIVPKHPNGLPMSTDEIDALLCYIITYFRGGILSVEDLSTLFGANLPIKFSGLLTNNAHRSCDLILSLQNEGRLSPMILENTNFIRKYRTNTSVDKYKTRLSGDYEILKIAELIINKKYDSGDKRFWLYINKDDMKIEGAVSNRMVTEAIQIYLNQNSHSELRPLINMRNNEGEPMYTYQQALIMKTRELFVKYRAEAA